MVRPAAAALVLLAATACTKDATQLVVAIDSDLDTLAAVDVSVSAVDGANPQSHRFEQPALPLSLAVSPGEKGPDERILLEITAIDGGDRTLVHRRIITHFEKNRAVLLRVFLPASCVGQVCGASLTCTEAGCIDEAIDPAALPSATPGEDIVPWFDGGAAQPDAEPNDRGFEDVLEGADANPDAELDGGFEDRPDVPSPDVPDPRDVPMFPDADGGINCATAPAGTPCDVNAECNGSICACLAPFDDCNATPGCETNTQTDPDHCGRCTSTCPNNERSCIGGQCRACAQNSDCAPDDGLTCTGLPICNNQACEYPLLAGSCLIDGACWMANQRNPNNPCLYCNAATPFAWTASPGDRCDDGLFCTRSDFCQMDGSCAGMGATCDDNLVCTTDSCNEPSDTCSNAINGTSCLIDGACWSSRSAHPTNPCLSCAPARSQIAWSANTGASCEDGLFCTSGDTCDASGACAGGPSPCNMVTPACVTITCDDNVDQCLNTVQPGWCFIDNNCVSDGTVNPFNVCEHCRPMNTQIDWSSRADGTPCGANRECCCAMCTFPGTCAC